MGTEHRAAYVGDELVHNGVAYRGTDQVGKLCRHLVDGLLLVYRGDILCLTVGVAKRATKSLVENDRAGLRLVKYQPFDASVFGDAA